MMKNDGAKLHKKQGRRRRWYRMAKFYFLQRVVLPAIFPVLWLYVRSCRVSLEPAAQVRELFDSEKRGAVAVLHGHMTPLLTLASRKHYGLRPPITVITSGSRDGQLMAALLKKFGQKCVVGSSARGGTSGLLGLRRTIREGRFAVVAVDGPRGPYAQAKPGVLALAENGRIPVFTLVTRARPAVQLNFFWDRHIIPLPFARIEARMVEMSIDHDSSAQEQLIELQRCLHREMTKLGHDVSDVPGVEAESPAC